MHRGGREVHCRKNYILETYCCILLTVAVRYAWGNTNHYLVLGCLRGTASTAHAHYLWKCIRFPINLPATLDGVNRLFAELRDTINKPPDRNASDRHGYPQKPGASSTPGLWHTGTGFIGLPGVSAA